MKYNKRTKALDDVSPADLLNLMQAVEAIKVFKKSIDRSYSNAEAVQAIYTALRDIKSR